MAYAQINYDQTQGINGKYTIHDIGCFITAFCNLEAGFGKQIAPDELNDFFCNRNIYIDVDDGVRDDVDWGFVQFWDVNTRVKELGGAGWPNSNDAIVKFAYTSPHTGRPTTHFCKVFDTVNHMIVDSWDGQTKHISSTVYGEPVASATYEHSAPQTVTPVSMMPAVPNLTRTVYTTPLQMVLNKDIHKYNFNHTSFEAIANDITDTKPKGYRLTVVARVEQHDVNESYYLEDVNAVDGWNVQDCDAYVPQPYVAPAGGIAVPKAQTYDLLTTVKYYTSADNARKDFDARGVIDKGTYILVKSDGTARQLAKKNTDTTTYWINDFDNKAVAVPPTPEPPTLPVDPPTPPVSEPVDDTSMTSTVVTDVTHPNLWKTTAKSLRADNRPVKFDALNSLQMQIRDLDMKHAAIPMPPYNDGKPVPIVSTFIKDGVTYGRTQKVATNNWWYGVPMDYLREHHESFIEEVEDDVKSWETFLENGFKSASKFGQFIHDVTPVQKQAIKQRAVQFIDGFKKGKK